MSKAVYVCTRDPADSIRFIPALEHLAERLAPDNLEPVPPTISCQSGIAYAVLAPNDAISVQGGSVCLGTFFDTVDHWWVPSTSAPDGSYALFRCNARVVELATDVVASRTIWYYLDNDTFIASTSQRAIIYLLGDFEFNLGAATWMLSTGNLGLRQSWDSRVHCLPGDSVLTLDRNSWKLSIATADVPFTPIERSEERHEELLRSAIAETFATFPFDAHKWALPLSGGYDSRGILCFLAEKQERPRTITWGLSESIDKEHNDATVARELARHFGLEHQYMPTDASCAAIDSTFRRFVALGEGRIDNIAGYMDGFAVWKNLHNMGFQGILRGDEGFGALPVASPREVADETGFSQWSEYENVTSLRDLGLPSQPIPDELLRRETETLGLWRDRLAHHYHIPVVLAALSDLKLPYVEIANPLLARRIIYVVRTIPDELRTDKALWKRIVTRMHPQTSIARHAAISTHTGFIQRPDVVEVLRDRLSPSCADAVLPRELLKDILEQIIADPAGSRRPAQALTHAHAFSRRARRRLRRALGYPNGRIMNYRRLAFRAYIVSETAKLYSNDAREGSRHHWLSTLTTTRPRVLDDAQ